MRGGCGAELTLNGGGRFGRMVLVGVRSPEVSPCGIGGCRFKLSDADYLQLAGEGLSALSAIVTVDREAAQILGVKFRRRES